LALFVLIINHLVSLPPFYHIYDPHLSTHSADNWSFGYRLATNFRAANSEKDPTSLDRPTSGQAKRGAVLIKRERNRSGERINRGLAKRLTASGLLCLYLVSTAAAASASNLLIRVCGLENRNGNLRVAVFSRQNANEFGDPSSQAYAVGVTIRLTAVEAEPALQIGIPGLVPGDYAVRVTHDENANGVFDLGKVIHTPEEPYGYSRNARASLGPVLFEDAAVEIGNTPTNIEIRMVRWSLATSDTTPCPP